MFGRSLARARMGWNARELATAQVGEDLGDGEGHADVGAETSPQVGALHAGEFGCGLRRFRDHSSEAAEIVSTESVELIG